MGDPEGVEQVRHRHQPKDIQRLALGHALQVPLQKETVVRSGAKDVVIRDQRMHAVHGDEFLRDGVGHAEVVSLGSDYAADEFPVADASYQPAQPPRRAPTNRHEGPGPWSDGRATPSSIPPYGSWP